PKGMRRKKPEGRIRKNGFCHGPRVAPLEGMGERISVPEKLDIVGPLKSPFRKRFRLRRGNGLSPAAFIERGMHMSRSTFVSCSRLLAFGSAGAQPLLLAGLARGFQEMVSKPPAGHRPFKRTQHAGGNVSYGCFDRQDAAKG